MGDLARVRVAWIGTGVVGPSVSTFYFNFPELGSCLTALGTFFSSLQNRIPQAVSVGIQGAGDVIDDQTGDWQAAWTATTPAGFAGTAAGSFVQGVGARVVWLTDGRRSNRRVRGSTFLTPLAGNQFDSSGNLTAASAAAIQTAAKAFVLSTAGSAFVWSRPRPGQSDGTSNALVDASCTTAPSWLRSRRT